MRVSVGLRSVFCDDLRWEVEIAEADAEGAGFWVGVGPRGFWLI